MNCANGCAGSWLAVGSDDRGRVTGSTPCACAIVRVGWHLCGARTDEPVAADAQRSTLINGLGGTGVPLRRTTMGLLEKLRPQPKWKHADPPSGSKASTKSTTADQDDAGRARDRRSRRARAPRRAGPCHRRRRRWRRSCATKATTPCAIRRWRASGQLAETGDERAALGAVAALAALGRQRELASAARASHARDRCARPPSSR